MKRLFGQLAVARGFVPQARVDEALAEQREEGRGSELGQILLRRGWISMEQFLEVLRLQQRFVLRCPSCDRSYDVFGYKRGDRFHCTRCSTALEVPRSAEELLGDPAVPPELAGRPLLTIGRYRVIREIARGGMGIVYHAYDPEMRREIALKVIRHDEAGPRTVERLRREAVAAARLGHPNIVRVYDVGEAEGMQYLAMEYVEGTSMERLVRRRDPDRDALARLLVAIARAVDHGHQHGIVHRDLKPANILVDGDGRPVVTDFGLAKVLDAETLLTRSGLVLGTPVYMAPEQAQGQVSRISARTDVYALGVMLYEILTGTVPHEGEDVMDVYRRIVEDEPVPPRALRSEIPAGMEAVCLKAIEKEPSARYATAAAFADDLERAIAGRPVLARPSGAAVRAARRLRRHPRTAAVVVALGAAVAVSVGLLARGDPSAGLEAKRREAAPLVEQARELLETAEKLYQVAGKPPVEAYERAGEALALLAKARAIAEVAGAALLEGDAAAMRYRISHERTDFAAAEEAYGRADAPFRLGRLRLERYQDLTDAREISNSADRRNRVIVYDDPPEATAIRDAALTDFDRAPGPFADAARAAMRREWAAAAESAGIALARERLAYDALFDLHRVRARACRELGRPADALPHADEMVRLRPADPAVRHQRGLTLAAADRLEDAIRDLDYVVERLPHLPGPIVSRGLCRMWRKDFDGSIADFSRMVEARGLPIDYTNRGGALLAKGDLDRARADFDAAIALAPDDPIAYRNRGSLHVLQERFDAALEDFSRVLEKMPESAEARYCRAYALFRLGRLEDALRDGEEAVRGAPDNVEMLYLLAQCHHKLDRFADAIRDYDRILALKPELVNAWNDRAGTKMTSGDSEGALADAAKASELAPLLGKPHFVRALALRKLGRAREAREAALKAKELDAALARPVEQFLRELE